MSSSAALWQQREQVLQTLYIPPSLQNAVPHGVIGGEMIDELRRAIQQYDVPQLGDTLELFCRGAAPRFFNLPSARYAIETAIRAELDAINQWLLNETTARFAFDYFGASTDPYVGYGVLKSNPTTLQFTHILRVVLQRATGNSYVLWTAFPLLSPRSDCWLDIYDYKSHAPKTRLGRIFYDFLNNYLSVTSDCVLVDSVVQGTTDFWRYESQSRLRELHATVQTLKAKSLDSADNGHLKYELSVRCLDETLPPRYLETPSAFVNVLQHSLSAVVGISPPSVSS